MYGYLIAAGIGCLAGLLLAPKKGSQFRDEIRERLEGLKAEGEDLKSDASQTLTRASEHVAKAGETAKDALGKLNENMQDIVQNKNQ